MHKSQIKSPTYETTRTWEESLDLPGAFHVQHIKNLMLSRPFFTRIPDQSLLLSETGVATDHLQATRDGNKGKRDATYVMVYTPVAKGIAVNTKSIKGRILKVWWFDPRTGKAIPVGGFVNKGAFSPPWDSLPWHAIREMDWVLVIDDAEKQYPSTGELLMK